MRTAKKEQSSRELPVLTIAKGAKRAKAKRKPKEVRHHSGNSPVTTKSLNLRILTIQKKLRLKDTPFCAMAQISSNTLSRVRNNEVITNPTLYKLIENCNVNPDWLMEGKRVPMFIEVAPESEIAVLKSENAALKAEINFLRELALGKISANFPAALDKIGSKRQAKIINLPLRGELSRKAVNY